MYKNVGLLLVVALMVLGFSTQAVAIKGEELIIKWWDKNNVEEIKDLLQPSVYMRVKDWGLRIPEIEYVPWERPQVWREATEKNRGGKCSIDPDEGLQGWKSGFPFPDPKTDLEIMWNYKKRYEADARALWQPMKLVSFKGPEKSLAVWFISINLMGRVRMPPIPEIPNNPERHDVKTMIFITEPFETRGFGTLQYAYYDERKEDDFWMYIPSLRRVRRGSSAARQDTWDGTEITIDDITYVSRIREYTYKIEEKECFVPLGTGLARDRDKRQPLNWTYARYQNYVVEATPKDPKYVYSKRIVWVDTGTYCPVGMAMYDKNGENWRHQVWPYLNDQSMTDEHKEKVTYHGNLDMPRQFDGWSVDFILGHCTFFEHHDCYYETEKFKIKELVPSYLKKMGR